MIGGIMKRNLIFLATVVFMFLLVSFWIAAAETRNNPIAVSPGSETEAVTVWQNCPTFSWSAADKAASYQIAVFESLDGRIAPYEAMAVLFSPVISKQIIGPALSYTLSSEERLKTGSVYAWFVQALDVSGNAIGSWSSGRIFQVEQEIRFIGIEEKLGEILKSYGVSDETAANVLDDLKSGVKEVVVPGITPGISGILGTEGVSNTFYGNTAGASITTGVENTFIGADAGAHTTSGNGNTFLGYEAGHLNSTGYYNICLGYGAGFMNETGYLNLFIGKNAGGKNDTGNNNVFIGHESGWDNDSGSNNTFVGNNAGDSNSTGYDNTIIGYYAGAGNTTGYANTFIGREAGKSITTGSLNTFIGKGAGNSNTTGWSNVFLGWKAGANETGSYKLYIANTSTSTPLIYGEFDNSIIKINGSLGIGVNPSYPLHMSSGAYCSTGGTWTNASSRALKENIENLSADEAVDALIKLNPVKYNYKVDKTDKHVGFIAEDVPELVAAADRKGLSPMDVTAVLTKVVQDQQNLIREQQRINKEQQKIISDLQERMAKVEKN